MILIERYDVLEKPIQQQFDKCGDAGSTLYITRIDVVSFIAVRVAQKKAVVRCNATGKIVAKKHWNQETHREAKELLAQHKTPKLGYYLLSTILITAIAGCIYLILADRNSTNSYKNSFMAKTDAEKTALLKTLGQGDLLLISNHIYRIKSIDNETVILEKNTSEIDGEKINSFKPIDESLIPNNTYTGSYEIKKEDFLKNNMVLDNTGTMITQYLDK
ncbi:hypothetical protein MG290_06585 [Flavobacterium sp. CBA20B-1]|uniref:hypothetical protein n=1 Tax=unclassified Flavobacterium TaxID=196869 RepID=UPI00222526EC|nr:MULTISPECIES: hypothetical protein [unclassified Flavobacterium]WCM43322.1 hypothetical protein MG290_06585 [Flavobacterium sp. CBA20B-1]